MYDLCKHSVILIIQIHIIFYFISFLLMLARDSKRKLWKEMKDKMKYNVDIPKINLSRVNEKTEEKVNIINSLI